MREYNFEYTNLAYAIKLFIVLFIVWPFSMFLSAKYLVAYTGPIPCIIALVLLPFGFFWFAKKNTTVKGRAFLDDTHVELHLHKANETIHFDEIESYMVQIMNGSLLKIKLKGGRKLRIQVNSNFCDPAQFDVFCDDLENSMEQYQVDTKTEINREKSFFEKKGTYYFLVIFSVALVGAIVFAVITGRKLKISSLLLSISALGSLWAGYMDTKARNSND